MLFMLKKSWRKQKQFRFKRERCNEFIIVYAKAILIKNNQMKREVEVG